MTSCKTVAVYVTALVTYFLNKQDFNKTFESEYPRKVFELRRELRIEKLRTLYNAVPLLTVVLSTFCYRGRLHDTDLNTPFTVVYFCHLLLLFELALALHHVKTEYQLTFHTAKY